MTYPAAAPPPAALIGAPCGASWRRPGSRWTTSWPRCSCGRASTSRSPSPRCPASSSTPARACARRSRELAALGVPAVILFGVPSRKDHEGSEAWNPDGIVQLALRDLRDDVGDQLVVMADCCLDEYTDHGHCGVLDLHRRGRQRRHHRALRPGRRRPGRRRRPRRRAQRDDGRPGRAPSGRRSTRPATPTSPSSPTRRSTPPPSTGRSATPSTCTSSAAGDRKGYQQDSRNAPRGAGRGRAPTWPRAPTWSWSSRPWPTSTSSPQVRARGRRARGRVPRERRVRDDQGRGGQRLDRRRRPSRSSTSPPSSGPAPTSSSPTWRASWPRPCLTPRWAPWRSRTAIPRAAPRPGAPRSPARAGAGLERRAVRAVPAGDPGRGELAGAGLPLGRRHAVLRGPGRGRRTSGTPRAGSYIDLVQSYGAIILGHAHPHVVEAITAAAADGTSYGAPTAREMKLAEAIRERVPSCEQVRLVNSGTEATMTALRLARGVTGPRPGREVRRQLPRPRRRAAGRRGQRRRHARPVRLGRGDRRGREPDGRGPVQRRARRSATTWPA